MAIRTTRDLKRYLDENNFSPETFARGTKISNMTIRRMMRHAPSWRIPEKYHLQMDFPVSSDTAPSAAANTAAQLPDFKVLMKDLEKAGKKTVDLEELENTVEKKLTKSKLGSNFATQVRELVHTAAGKIDIKSRALAVGALLYFANPFDLIPDALAGVGYLDDFAVLSLVGGFLVRDGKISARRKSHS